MANHDGVRELHPVTFFKRGIVERGVKDFRPSMQLVDAEPEPEPEPEPALPFGRGRAKD